MAEQAGHGDGQGATPRRGPGLPGGDGLGSGSAASDRDARLSGFGKGGEWDTCLPSGSLAVALEAACGPEGRCPGAFRDEMFGLLRRWQALESRAAAGKLAVLRALIRDDDQPLPGGGYHGDLPEGWTKSLTHEVATALSMPAVSADQLMWTAWNLEGRLPGVGALLKAGVLTYSKAKAVDDALQQLSDGDAAAAEAMILPELPGKTYGQALKLAVQAAITVDPESATRRRQDAEANKCRVHLVREESGAAGLSGRDMPTDQTLAAHANVCARAQEYKESGAFGDDVRMDQYRVAAYLDLLNGISCDVRIASGVLPGTCPADEPPTEEPPTEEPAAGGPSPGQGDCSCRECDGSCSPPPPDDDEPTDDPDDGEPGDDPDHDEPGDDPDGGVPGDDGPRGGPGTGGNPPCGGTGHSASHGSRRGHGSPGDNRSDDGPGDYRREDSSSDYRSDGSSGDERTNAGPSDLSDRGPGDDRSDSGPADKQGGKQGGKQSGGQPVARPASGSATPPSRLADLVLPLATLLGLAERPGEGHGLGPLDPDLCRELAIAAAGSPYSRLCVTVTDPDGIAIGHGCAHPAKRGKLPGPTDHGSHASPGPACGLVALPAQVNLTISAARLAELAAATGPPGPAAWKFTRDDANRGPATGGYGTWTLTLPDGRNLTAELQPVPTFECFDHRYESHAYQPSDSLRHLVQIRDGECTFPPCSRHAKESDFEHAIPFDKGGRTCACNAGARSRACHQVKQSKGWNVTQPKPGWHQWTTPSGRVYMQGPKRYPA